MLPFQPALLPSYPHWKRKFTFAKSIYASMYHWNFKSLSNDHELSRIDLWSVIFVRQKRGFFYFFLFLFFFIVAYRVVHSSSSFSLVLLITTIITKKIGSCSLVPFDILPNIPWFFKNPWGTLTDPGPHKIWNSSLGCCPLFFALLVFCRHQLEMVAQLCFKIVVFLLYFSSWRTILREFHYNCY